MCSPVVSNGARGQGNVASSAAWPGAEVGQVELVDRHVHIRIALPKRRDQATADQFDGICQGPDDEGRIPGRAHHSGSGSPGPGQQRPGFSEQNLAGRSEPDTAAHTPQQRNAEVVLQPALARLSGGWVTCSRAAAVPMLCSSATATK